MHGKYKQNKMFDDLVTSGSPSSHARTENFDFAAVSVRPRQNFLPTYYLRCCEMNNFILIGWPPSVLRNTDINI